MARSCRTGSGVKQARTISQPSHPSADSRAPPIRTMSCRTIWLILQRRTRKRERRRRSELERGGATTKMKKNLMMFEEVHQKESIKKALTHTTQGPTTIAWTGRRTSLSPMKSQGTQKLTTSLKREMKYPNNLRK